MISAVADAGVAVKWCLPPADTERDRDQAIALRQPPHWLTEVAAVLSRLAPATARQDIEDLYAMRIPVVETVER